jgi:RecA-family ATPase
VRIRSKAFRNREVIDVKRFNRQHPARGEVSQRPVPKFQSLKTGKSWAAVDLAISLALGCDWLGFAIPRPVKVALVSREDNPGLTAWRIKHLLASKESHAPGLLESNLYVNSRRQSPQLMLDNEEQVDELAKAMKSFEAEFAIFDVFNVMHGADENNNSEMRRVLQKLSQLQAEVGCSIGVVHHYSKASDPELPLSQRLRGAGAIAGWCEWLIGIAMADSAAKIRCMEFDIKADNPPTPVHFTIDSDEEHSWTKLARVDYVPRKHATVAGYMRDIG